MSNVETWKVPLALLKIRHIKCGERIELRHLENRKLYAHCATCKNSVRINPEKKWAKLPGGTYGYIDETWPPEIILSVED